MEVKNIFELIMGLALFLFGMNVMGGALQRRAGLKLKTTLQTMTSTIFRGFILGVGTTVIMQSSSATTVMAVGFVNSGLLTLRQSIGIIFGANLGATITPWLLSLTSVGGSAGFMQYLKLSYIVPILAIVFTFIIMFSKKTKAKDTAMIIMGFAVLMYGMEVMSGSVEGLRDDPNFTQILTMFNNPLLGVLVGTVFTAVIQSSSASIGIFQALSTTGSITYGAAVPIIMGQNIGTCISALMSSIGATKNARRVAIIHLAFNVLATLIFLPIFCLVTPLVSSLVESTANPVGVALVNTGFKTLALVLMPLATQFEKFSRFVIRDKADDKDDETVVALDERLFATPNLAIESARNATIEMAQSAITSMKDAITLLDNYNEVVMESVRKSESAVDIYEDKIGSYLVRLSSHSMREGDSTEATKLLHLISDFERISDHSLSVAKSAEEIKEKKLEFSEDARAEIKVLCDAIVEICGMAFNSFVENDLETAFQVEPLEQVVDYLKDKLKRRHIKRLTKGDCTIELGFILTDLLTCFERVSDHCSNIAACVIEMAHEEMDMHEYLHGIKSGEMSEFNEYYDSFKAKYSFPKEEHKQ